jgi:hypothetical protein
MCLTTTKDEYVSALNDSEIFCVARQVVYKMPFMNLKLYGPLCV